jgi:ABC-2 type transport system permease protein
MNEAVDSGNDVRWVIYSRAFFGLMQRDMRVLSREIVPFLIRVAMNPLLFLFVFTYVMPHMSGGARMSPVAGLAAAGGSGGFGTVLLPGLMAVAIMFSGIAAVALPLAQEFGVTREIDDRVMCPLPIGAVAIEKIVFSGIQSLFAAAVVFPLAYYIPSACVELVVSDCGAGARESAGGRAGPDDRDIRTAKADWVDLRRGDCADHVSWVCVLPLGRPAEH